MDPIQSTKPKNKPILVVIVILVLLLLGLYFLGSKSGQPQSNYTKENTKVDTVDLKTAQGDARLPSGFPANIPVETSTVYESYTTQYLDRGVTLSALSYTSDKKISDLYDSYSQFLVKNGYSIRGGTNTDNQKSMFGFKDNADLSVILSVDNGKTVVQLAYTSRQ